MEQFSLEKHLENPSRKIVTRRGNPVRIICIDRKSKSGNIVGLVGEDESLIYVWDNNGNHIVSGIEENDLFFADEEEGLTEFDKCLLSAFYSVAGKAVTTIGPASFQEDVNEWSKTLLDLARKEILKDAVEAFVNTYENTDNSNYVEFVTEQSPYKFKETEKCKLIIVKED